jgi:hypothetical protein
MRTIAASGLIALTAMLGVAASTAVASSATAAQRPAAASSASAAKPAEPAKAPPPANQLFGVSCVSSKYCVAVGLNENAEESVKGGGALIQTWNGKTWKSVAPKAPKGALSAQLLGVSCKSAIACVAVGVFLNASGTGVPLAEIWNGKTWTPAAPATPKGSSGGELLGVSCAAAKSCVAVGSDFTNSGGAALAESWNGSKWTLSRPPEPKGSVVGELNKVSCTSTAHCVAVGSWGTNTAGFALAESWNGNAWARTPVPAPAVGKNDADLTGVSCPSAKSCVAVGTGTTGVKGGLVSYAEFWNGKTWTAGKIAWPKGVSNNYLTGVSCRSAKSCLAVGNLNINVNDGGHTGRAGATSWNGKAWTAANVAAPGKGKASLFTEVSCLSATNCVAVGQFGPFNSDEGNGLAGFWNGKRVSLATT